MLEGSVEEGVLGVILMLAGVMICDLDTGGEYTMMIAVFREAVYHFSLVSWLYEDDDVVVIWRD